jgi:hypothetical protein
MNGASSDAAAVPDAFQSQEEMIENVRGRGYCLVFAPCAEEAAANLEKM